MRGMIALDIDGTLTTSSNEISVKIAEYLSTLEQDGWVILFITGRTLKFANNLFKPLKFPYYLAVQNGASTVKMPGKSVIFKHYIYRELLAKMDKICKEYDTDFVIASGHEDADRFYYRPNNYNSAMLHYLKKRADSQKEHWIAVENFDQIEINSFASLKCF